MVANFWRALQSDADEVARWADWPVNENDLHARHQWLVRQRDWLTDALDADPDYFHAKIAGWWVWGLCQWIGQGWCLANHRQRPHLGNAGRGIHRQLPHLGCAGRGIHRQRPHLGDAGRGIDVDLLRWFAQRLRSVRVCCGDWSRVCGPTPTVTQGLTGVFLDPPYTLSERDENLYVEDRDVAAHVCQWAIERGNDPRMRIVLCGYDGEHEMPETWTAYAWKARGGYGLQGNGRGRDNASRERLWFSPHCQPVEDRQLMLW